MGNPANWLCSEQNPGHLVLFWVAILPIYIGITISLHKGLEHGYLIREKNCSANWCRILLYPYSLYFFSTETGV